MAEALHGGECPGCVQERFGAADWEMFEAGVLLGQWLYEEDVLRERFDDIMRVSSSGLN